MILNFVIVYIHVPCLHVRNIFEEYFAMEFFLNMKCEFIDKNIFVITAKGLEPANSCVTDKDVTTAPARHMWETGSLNWVKVMVQWFQIPLIRWIHWIQWKFWSICPFRKTPLWTLKNYLQRPKLWERKRGLFVNEMSHILRPRQCNCCAKNYSSD